MGLFALWECFAIEVKGWGHAILLTVTSLRMLCRLELSQKVDNPSYRIDSWHLFPFFGAGMRRSRRSVLNVEQLPPPDPRLVRSAHPSDDVAFQNLVKIMHSDEILLSLLLLKPPFPQTENDRVEGVTAVTICQDFCVSSPYSYPFFVHTRRVAKCWRNLRCDKCNHMH